MTSNTDWEKKFEELQAVREIGDPYNLDSDSAWIPEIKAFIERQISLAEKRGQKKAVEFISRHEDTEWATDDICYVPKELLEQAKNL